MRIIRYRIYSNNEFMRIMWIKFIWSGFMRTSNICEYGAYIRIHLICKFMRIYLKNWMHANLFGASPMLTNHREKNESQIGRFSLSDSWDRILANRTNQRARFARYYNYVTFVKIRQNLGRSYRTFLYPFPSTWPCLCFYWWIRVYLDVELLTGVAHFQLKWLTHPQKVCTIPLPELLLFWVAGGWGCTCQGNSTCR